eukprot:395217-Amphidinium_carterae.1
MFDLFFTYFNRFGVWGAVSGHKRHHGRSGTRNSWSLGIVGLHFRTRNGSSAVNVVSAVQARLQFDFTNAFLMVQWEQQPERTKTK